MCGQMSQVPVAMKQLTPSQGVAATFVVCSTGSGITLAAGG